jgi:hypothetical protein
MPSIGEQGEERQDLGPGGTREEKSNRTRARRQLLLINSDLGPCSPNLYPSLLVSITITIFPVSRKVCACDRGCHVARGQQIVPGKSQRQLRRWGLHASLSSPGQDPSQLVSLFWGALQRPAQLSGGSEVGFFLQMVPRPGEVSPFGSFSLPPPSDTAIPVFRAS